MPYLDGRPFNPITSFGKVVDKSLDEKFHLWTNTAPRPKDKLKFGLTHPDTVISQVREKKHPDFTYKMSNLTKNLNKIPSKPGIYSFGKPSESGTQFPNYPGQFHTQSPQIQNRHGARLDQQNEDGNT